MEPWMVIAGWVACSVAAFAIFVDAVRSDGDVYYDDIGVLILMSAIGPASVIVSMVFWVAFKGDTNNAVAFKRKRNK